MTAGYNPHAGGVVKEYKPTDIALFDQNGLQQVISLLQQPVIRATQMGKMLFFELELQVTISTVGGATFLQMNLPVELNPKDPNTAAIINVQPISAGPTIGQLVGTNTVNPTGINGANPVAFFLEPLTAGAKFQVGPCDFFGCAFWTLA